MTWPALVRGAPELARLGSERLDGGLALLGTVRRDGSPRVSPVGTFFVGGELVIGVMRSSAKARDLRCDPRYALQSVVTEPDAGVPELKLNGHVEASDLVGGWWTSRPDEADVYRLVVTEATYVEWDLAAERMRVRRWTPERGERVDEQPYP